MSDLLPKDFEVSLRLKNNRLKERRVRAGLTLKQLAAIIGVSAATLGQVENLFSSPRMRTGDWKPWVPRLASFFEVTPDELFPGWMNIVKEPHVRKTCNVEEIPFHLLTAGNEPAMLEEAQDAFRQVESKEQRRDLQRVIGKLPRMQRCVLTKRFHEDKTLEEAGREIGVSRTRARQIEGRALRNLQRFTRDLRGEDE